ncbi:LysR family transcriptional regulator [Erwinia amylovora]|uniref:putrescine utilization regulator PtrR n=1 Tax=Erwinia amylovora TaxID=552 RepID=UPI000C078ECE|nr:LysR family transcriptional regulator [Erwinia amylovora]MBZ2398604.1 LysR family transcriptional regulator [Erwinia amylovora]MBZ2402239.1 LysR family transcriptional regulator [Erwinia amylovora]UDJ85546.1 LysR family transcriptional regulator [Erwinia amylovora]UDK00189.1 LysR family transcriptional regulator [Erwinia amylovora]UDK90926.1 LysR family transcriptional regulator [Erwinia amylovora]
MDLTQLKMFCAVADCGSMARAAQQLHRVPSNLTTRLRQLEEELGGNLFIREKQRLRLSPMGHNFLCYARRILLLSEEALSMTQASQPGGHFALGSTESTAATRLPLLLAEFHRRYPAVRLALVTGTSGELIERVRAGTLAAALVDGPVNIDELNGCVAFHEELVLISSLDHRLISRPADAAGCTLFAFRPGCSYRVRCETWFLAAGVQPGSVTEIPSYHAMLACVASGGGLALLPAAVLAQLPGHERVRQHPLPPAMRDTRTLLIWRRDAFSANIEALKYLIIEHLDANSRE